MSSQTDNYDQLVLIHQALRCATQALDAQHFLLVSKHLAVGQAIAQLLQDNSCTLSFTARGKVGLSSLTPSGQGVKRDN